MHSVLASGSPWYSSGTFWAIVGVIAALTGTAAILITWRIAPPRRLIVYNMPVATSLLTSHASRLHIRGADLQVTYRGEPLRNPYFVTLNVESRSRRDIRSSDFDQNRPLTFDVDAPIKAVVGGTGPIEWLADVVTIEGSKINLTPSLIRRGEVLRLSFLIEGSPHLSCKNPLVDVIVREQEPDPIRRRSNLILLSISFLAAVTVIALTVIGTPNHSQQAALMAGVLTGGALVSLIFLGTLLMYNLGERRGRRDYLARSGH